MDKESFLRVRTSFYHCQMFFDGLSLKQTSRASYTESYIQCGTKTKASTCVSVLYVL